MTILNARKRLSSLVPAVAIVLAVSACGGQGASNAGVGGSPDAAVEGSGGHVSRAHIYDSLDELVQDSDVVITGTAISHEEVTDANDPTLPWTLTSFEVGSVAQSKTNLQVGDTILIRQVGSEAIPTENAPLLVDGTNYLLALKEVAQPASPGPEYIISGVTAGMFEATSAARGGSPVYTAVTPDSPDNLPEELSEQDVSG